MEKSKDAFIINLLTLTNQMRILHWQTESYSQHQALGKTYEKIADTIDDLIEIYQGKYGKLKVDEDLPINLMNIENINITKFIDKFYEYLSKDIYDKKLLNEKEDIDIQDIIIDILNALNKLKYLLSLK